MHDALPYRDEKKVSLILHFGDYLVLCIFNNFQSVRVFVSGREVFGDTFVLFV